MDHRQTRTDKSARIDSTEWARVERRLDAACSGVRSANLNSVPCGANNASSLRQGELDTAAAWATAHLERLCEVAVKGPERGELVRELADQFWVLREVDQLARVGRVDVGDVGRLHDAQRHTFRVAESTLVWHRATTGWRHCSNAHLRVKQHHVLVANEAREFREVVHCRMANKAAA